MPALWKHSSVQSLAASESDQIQFLIYKAFCRGEKKKKNPTLKSHCRVLKQSYIFLLRSDPSKACWIVQVGVVNRSKLGLWDSEKGKNSNLGIITFLILSFLSYSQKQKNRKQTHPSACCEACLPSFCHVVCFLLMTSVVQQVCILVRKGLVVAGSSCLIFLKVAVLVQLQHLSQHE